MEVGTEAQARATGSCPVGKAFTKCTGQAPSLLRVSNFSDRDLCLEAHGRPGWTLVCVEGSGRLCRVARERGGHRAPRGTEWV